MIELVRERVSYTCNIYLTHLHIIYGCLIPIIFTDETPKKKGKTGTVTPMQPINGASAQVTASLTKLDRQVTGDEDEAEGKDAEGNESEGKAEESDGVDDDAEVVDDDADVVDDDAEGVDEDAEGVDPTPNAFVQEVCNNIVGCSIEGSISTLKHNLRKVLDNSITNDQANMLKEDDWNTFVKVAQELGNTTMAKAGLRIVVRDFQRSKVQPLA